MRSAAMAAAAAFCLATAAATRTATETYVERKVAAAQEAVEAEVHAATNALAVKTEAVRKAALAEVSSATNALAERVEADIAESTNALAYAIAADTTIVRGNRENDPTYGEFWTAKVMYAVDAGGVQWKNVYNRPTTVADYGISDAATKGSVAAATNALAAKVDGKADASALADYATTNTVAGLASTVSALWSYAYGEMVWIAVTNYQRSVEGVVPSMQLWEVRDGKTNLVYSTAEEISNKVAKAESRISADIQGGLAAVRSEIPSTAWSRYQSMTGAENPDPENVTVVSTPQVMLTGGAEWTQYLDASSNCLWVLSSRGLVMPSVDTNGYFRIIDAEGNAAFEVIKEGAQTVDALPQSNPSVSDGVMSVTFHAASKPTLYLAETLTNGAFRVETDDPNASVDWTDGGDGTWTAAISFVDVRPSYFCYATFTRQGGTAIRATAPMSLDGGISVGDKVIRPVINTDNTVTWEVKQ